MICSGCGKEIADSAKFCKYCGAKIEPPKPKKRFCTECGKELSENAKFCKSCGARVGAAPEGKPDAPAADIPVLTIPVKGPVLSVEITDELPAQKKTAERTQTAPTTGTQAKPFVQPTSP